MKRRAFLAGLGGAAAWPLAAYGQTNSDIRRIGILSGGNKADGQNSAGVEAFKKTLSDLGWIEGHNIRIDLRFFAGNFEQLPQLAQELIALNPNVVFASTTPIVKALQSKTQTTPIVFLLVSDPVGAGVIASLSHPGGNTTGLLLYQESITGKWLGMLKEISPNMTHAALVANPGGFTYDYFVRSSKTIAPNLGIEVMPTPLNNSPGEIKQRIETLARHPNIGLFVPPDTTTVQYRDLIISLAAQHRLPAVYAFRSFVDAGGLMSYGIDLLEQYRQAASYVDRILRGARPADLPVQAPTKYETVINLKTAKALSLAVPPTLLVRADEVIE
jgi:putative ABC transport system substrate-binding protein